MQTISDKIRHYRKIFRPPIFYALDSSALWLSMALASLILGLLLVDLYLRLAESTWLLSPLDQLSLLLTEVPLLLGTLQVYFTGAERRYRQLYPTARRVSLRTPHTALALEKRARLQETFKHGEDLRSLAKALIDEWEWRRELKVRAQEVLWRKAVGFFGLPSASNFAAYMTGLLAVCASIVIAGMSPGSVFGSFDEFLDNAWSLTHMLWLVIVIPFAVCVLPGAVILSGIKNIGEALIEALDDQHLSSTAFYRFISEILQLHDRSEPLHLRKTRAWVYWSVRLTMVPLHKVPGVWRRIKRAKALRQRVVRRKAG